MSFKDKLKNKRKSTNIIDASTPTGKAKHLLDLDAKDNANLREKTPAKNWGDGRSEIEKIIENPALTRTAELSTSKSVDERAKNVRDPKPKTFDFFKHEDISKSSRKIK